ncbi:MAG: M28 family peptidase [Pirellulaceae bacterium]|nr:M28 family peptidase [Pirellulaceae bacterium]
MSRKLQRQHSQRKHSQPNPSQPHSWAWISFGGVGILVALSWVFFLQDGSAGSRGRGRISRWTLGDIPFDGSRSFKFLQEICEIGPRPSGSKGMQQQQEMLTEHFVRLGAQVSMQEWDERHPLDGSRVSMKNMIIEWHPERLDRIVLCAHYDTRPYPDQDPVNPRGVFVGANDGASGVALLCELGRHMPKFRSVYGVDFVFFDAEEFVFPDDRGKYFLGSEYFAKSYLAQVPRHRYHWGVLFDMVGDEDLHLYREKNSYLWSDTRPLVKDIWSTARAMQVTEFIDRTRHKIRDDHLALHDIAKIPTCDIIDFDYPRTSGVKYWHTEQDTPEKCSALSLAKVGWVTLEWLKRVEKSLPPEPLVRERD